MATVEQGEATSKGPMRLVIAASPKSGNVWVECLLARVYRVQVIDSSAEWDYRSWRLPPGGFVTHQHLPATADVLDWGRDEGIRFVGIVRHPCDMFLSIYHYVNNFAEAWKRKGLIGSSPSHSMIGQPLDSAEVERYLREEFRTDVLETSIGWMAIPDVPLVRYEELHVEPLTTLNRLTSAFTTVGDKALEDAVRHCSIDRMRKRSEHLKLHCREGKTGRWRKNMPAPLQDIMREHHAEVCAHLGYSITDD